MEKENNKLLGGWIQAVGTVLSALGNTPRIALSSDIKDDLKLIGNVMQATGNTLQVKGISLQDLNSLGNEIQAVGNITEVASLRLPVTDNVKSLLGIQGDLMQALGGGMNFAEEWQKEITVEVMYNGFGNLLQVIGNSLQALSTRSTTNATEINTIGNWIQVIGAIMTAIAGSVH
ncbi:DUF6944 family repetitive protein [Gracilibacillus sp. D59]|uniref:DUF6944 family repetitive protein n=1 Tax=Gracilibacillus sp. D59 TaxID=3457434 RepID=UPI003FCEE60E